MPILGIDLGASTTVLATIGKGGVTIVRNDLAERLTPTLVAYTEKERLLGDAALTSLKSNVKCTVRNFKNLLGAVSASENEALIKSEEAYALAPLVPTECGQLVGYDVGREEPVTATEVFASFLKKLKQMADAYIGAAVTDVVVAVPSWFTDANRQAVLDACDIARLGCLKVMSHSTATALDYGLFRSSQFQPEKPQIVSFVDIGYSSATVTVVEYLPSQLTVLAVAEDPSLGGRTLDRLIVNHLVEVFKSKSGLDCRKNAKAMLKLEEAAEKAKKVLSANKEAHVHLECFMEDEDLSCALNRQDFEQLCGDYKANLSKLCHKVVEEANLKAESLLSVEICGGCTRIPFIQAAIEQIFDKPISRTVSADECVARGAAIQGAMLDRRYRVKEFRVGDRRFQPVYLTFEDTTLAQGVQINDKKQPVKHLEQDPNTLLLFEAGCPSFFVQWITLPQSMTAAEVKFRLTTSDTVTGGLRSLGEFTLNVTEKMIAAMSKASPNNSKLKIGFQLDLHGILRVESVFNEEIIEQEKYVERRPKIDEDGKAIEGEFEETQMTRPKKKTEKREVRVAAKRPNGWLDSKQIDLLRAKEKKMSEQDFETQEARRLRNDILASCFRYREALSDNGAYNTFATPDEKAAVLDMAEKAEAWAEENDDLPMKEYKAAHDRLTNQFAPIEVRFREEARKREEAQRAEEARSRAAQEAELESLRLQAEAAAKAEAPDAAMSEPDAAMGTPTPDQ